MKHSDLKVGMKVKRVSCFDDDYYSSTEGNISTVREILNYTFRSEEDDSNDYYWEAQYFEPVEEKEEQTMNTESKLITLDKKYKTRCGYPVRVLCVDRNDPTYPVVVLVGYPGGDLVDCYCKTGVLNEGEVHDLDLIEVSPYEDFKKDDKVMVSSDGQQWYKRYFAYELEGIAYCWNDSMGSWTADKVVSWSFCRKPAQEELGE